MIKADGSVDPQEVTANFDVLISPPAYDGSADTRVNLEDDFRGSPLNISGLQGHGFDLEIYESTARMRGTDTSSLLMKMAIYEYLTWNDGGELFGVSEAEEVYNGIMTKTFYFSPYISIPSDDDWVFIGCLADSGSGTVEIDQDTEPGAKGIYDLNMYYPNFDDPLNNENGLDGTMYLVQGRFYGENNTVTSFNHYYGSPTDYTARRDIDANFPDGVGNRDISFTYPKTENLVNISYSNEGSWDLALTSSDYTKSSLNATHYLIEIPETTIGNYGDSFQLFTGSYKYNYVLHGPYYENGTFTGDLNITAVMDLGPVEYYLNGTISIGTNDKIMFFFWDLPGGGTRRIYPVDDNEIFYLFIPYDTYMSYAFDITDYIGAIGFQDSYLELYSSTNSTTYLVERYLIWDSESQSPLTAMLNKIYSLQIISPGDKEHSFGYWVPTTATPPTLTLSILDPDEYYQPISGIVNIEATRPTPTHIQIEYLDKMDLTLSVFIEITLRNDTVVYNVTGGSSTQTFNWYEAVNTTEYVVNVYVSHTYYGEITYSYTLLGETEYYPPPSWSIIGIQDEWIWLGLIVVVAGTVSMANSAVGLFAGASLASAFVYLNLVEIPYELLAGAFIISILMGLTKR